MNGDIREVLTQDEFEEFNILHTNYDQVMMDIVYFIRQLDDEKATAICNELEENYQEIVEVYEEFEPEEKEE
jgi:hypothetical protein